MRKLFFFLLPGIILLYNGCKNDLDILADYKPFLLCYGLLNPADTVHYIRIEKVFGGEGNALEMAQNPDSIGFAPGTIDAKLERWYNGTLQQSITLTEDTTIPRDSGLFLHPYQLIFKGVFPVYKDGSTYKIKVTDLVKGTSISAETPIVQDAVLVEPSGIFSPLNLWDTTNIRFTWKSGKYAKRYAFKVRFHYQEQFIFDTTEVSDHYVDWDIASTDALTDEGDQTISFSVQRNNFMRTLAIRIPENTYVRRIAGKIDFIFLGGAQDFATYLDVQTANSNSSAALPPFTNVNGGYGLFSSRTTSTFPGYSLDSDTRYQLRVSLFTQGLNFIR